MERRTFLQYATLSGTAIAFDMKTSDPVIGHGDYRFRIRNRWCRANPEKNPVKNCHEMAMDRSGRIFMTTDDTRNNILIFNKDGEVLDAWGHEYPGAHGLTLHDENGTEFLYITDYDRNEVIKTTLDGRVAQIFQWPSDSGMYKNKTEFLPTETAIAPNGDVIIADGYGKDYVLRYSPDGKLKSWFGGPGVVQNAHGVALDTRDKNNPVWLVTSRAENDLLRFNMNGELLERVHLPGAYICRPVVHGNLVLFAVLISQLPWDSGTGFVCILDDQNKMVSAPGANIPKYENGRLHTMYQTVQVFKHPHDVLVDPDGNLYVSQWNSGGVYPIQLLRI